MELSTIQLGILILSATICALFFRLVKLPPLLGYLAAGLLLGPIGIGYLNHQEWLEASKQISMVVLLFLVGLELDWTKAKHQIGTTATFSAIQMVASFAAGFTCAVLLGLDTKTALFLGAGLAFSSTITVIKLLSDSRDLHTLHGRLSLGVLLFEDAAAAIVIVIAASLGHNSALPLSLVLLLLSAKTIILSALLWMAGQYLLPYLFSHIARSTELLFLSSLGWCFTVVIIASQFDVPPEIGGLLAGISLASLPYTLDIINRLRAVRDLCAIALFVILGSELIIPERSYLIIALVLTALVTVGRPAISFLLLNARGYKNRTSFLVSLAQGQLSELSLLLIASGLTYRFISPEWGVTMTFITVASFFISVPVLTWREKIYGALRPLLQRIERKNQPVPSMLNGELHGHIVILGYHRMGYHILKKLRNFKQGVVVVDFNPDIVKKLTEQEIPCVYGDIEDEDLLELVQAENASMVISTVPHREETVFLIERLRKLEQPPLVIVTSHHIDDALEYYKLGASYVILPHILGGEHVGELITEYQHNSLETIIARRVEEVKLLRAKNHALYYD